MFKRTVEDKVKYISTATAVFGLLDNQHFCSTDKCWEIWQTEPSMFLRRWHRKSVFWVVPKE